MGKVQVLLSSCFQQPMASAAKLRRKFVRRMILPTHAQRCLVIDFYFVVSNAKECSLEIGSWKTFFFITLR